MSLFGNADNDGEKKAFAKKDTQAFMLAKRNLFYLGPFLIISGIVILIDLDSGGMGILDSIISGDKYAYSGIFGIATGIAVTILYKVKFGEKGK